VCERHELFGSCVSAREYLDSVQVKAIIGPMHELIVLLMARGLPAAQAKLHTLDYTRELNEAIIEIQRETA